MWLLMMMKHVVGTTEPKVLGLRLTSVNSNMGYTEDGVISVVTGVDLEMELIGVNINKETVIKLTTTVLSPGQDCDESNGTLLQTKHFKLQSIEDEENKYLLSIPSGDIIYSPSQDTYRVCVKNGEKFLHQGNAPELRVHFYRPMMPVWIMAVLVSVLLCLSGLFSGLNLGLMALDQTELQIVISTGTEQEQADAKAIVPIRAMGNFLLCSLLLGNVLVNNTLTIMLDNLTGGGGLWAVIGSTLGIVVFGEIIPQALCSRHGLAVGAKTLFITKFFMMITSPLSYPISKLLDWILGEELGTVYNRARLLELLKVTMDATDLNKDEVNILCGALVLQEKTVENIMTPLADCYMLPVESVLDFKTVSEIKNKGYSRIPVYSQDETNIVYILLAKDLLFVDTDDSKPLEEICKFYKTPFEVIDKSTHLNKMLDIFKSGEKGHLAMVKDSSDEGSVIGLVTLEDIIEEIIQAEIVDETDIVLDNKTRKKRKSQHGQKNSKFLKEKEYEMFVGNITNKVEISPQVVHAVLQFLSTSLPPFSQEIIKTDILRKLLNMDVFREIKFTTEEEAKDTPILVNGKASESFILIVEGKVEVQIGKEGYAFEAGPFTSFGKQILEQMLDNIKQSEAMSPSKEKSSWIPDSTIVAKSNVLYLKLKAKTYKAAVLGSKANTLDIPNSDTIESHLAMTLTSQASDVKEEDPLL